MTVDINAVRERAWHYLTPEVAACAGLTLAELQQFVAGAVSLSDQQLECLAHRMGLS
jgi:hypothetical protein